jgi:hypothetical protein
VRIAEKLVTPLMMERFKVTTQLKRGSIFSNEGLRAGSQ